MQPDQGSRRKDVGRVVADSRFRVLLGDNSGGIVSFQTG